MRSVCWFLLASSVVFLFFQVQKSAGFCCDAEEIASTRFCEWFLNLDERAQEELYEEAGGSCEFLYASEYDFAPK